MAVSVVLYPHSTGYGLFRVEQLNASVLSISFQDFNPFVGTDEQFLNILAFSWGYCTPTLKQFLQDNVVLKDVTIGILDPCLGSSVSAMLGVKVLLLLKSCAKSFLFHTGCLIST